MHDNVNKTPRLYRVINKDSGEVFNTFAKSKTEAASSCFINIGDIFTIEEVRVVDGGVPHLVFRLKDIIAGSTGAFFRTVNCSTLKVGKTTWLKKNGDYDRSTKKYCCITAEDICKSREFKPTQWVIATFTY